MNTHIDQLSKFMSLILRHKPEQFGIKIDHEGYCLISDLLLSIQKNRKSWDVKEEDILEAVRTCPKQRYQIAGDMIRATYGHSAKHLSYPESTPPEILYHGTNESVADIIRSEGIKKMQRNYVHLSESTHFAKLAGERRGKLVLLQVDTKRAIADGVKFYYAENEVWLADFVPAQYIIN